MKKFFKKKSAMIGSIVAAAVVLVLLIAFCVRPVSVGYTYKHYEEDTKTATYLHFNTFNKVTMSEEVDGKETEEREYWYFVKDGVVITSNVTTDVLEKEDWEKFKEETLKDWNEDIVENNGLHINAFSIKTLALGKEVEDAKMTCAGAVATVVVLAVVEVALLGAVAYAVMVSKKK